MYLVVLDDHVIAAVRKNVASSDLGSDVIIRSFTYTITQKQLRKILNELPLLTCFSTWAIFFHPIYKTKPINTSKRKTVSLYDSYEEWNIHKNLHGHKIAVTNSESVQI